ncbi:MAG: DUF4007 family protein [Candidatus Poribacteria bacterium]|nr:DUF4007 family protein [Candidatus Poribacteria bacterium]
MENFLAEHTTPPYLVRPSFSGHQTFPFRYTWLKKGVDAVIEKSNVFADDDAPVVLGVGKNMVSSIRHWCLAANLIEKKEDGSDPRGFKASDFGEAIFKDKKGFDPYLENPSTLWWIHWKIATNKDQAATCSWAFNFLNYPEFTKKSLTKDLIYWIKQQKNIRKQPSENTIQKDVNCFFRTYCLSHSSETAIIEDTFDCPLVELDLIREVQVEQDENRYQFNLGAKPSLTDSMLALTITAFWNDRFPNANTLSFSKIMYSKLSPGQVFKLDENTLVMHLEKLESITDGNITYDDTAGLKQISRREKLDTLKLLKGVYE